MNESPQVADELIVQRPVNWRNVKKPSSPRYKVSNVTLDRIYDADATSLNELADILGTLLKDLRDQGVIG